MSIPDEELFFEHHLASYRSMGFVRDGESSNAFWRARAAQMQFYRVQDALIDQIHQTVALSGQVPEGMAFDHLRYGAGRRLKIVWQSVRDLQSVAPLDRRKPMKQEEVDTASRALNDFYIHTLGLLDNYAYAIGARLAGDRFSKLHRGDRTLFGRRFLDCCDSLPLRSLIEPFRDWVSALKSLRNPVAHGIPLTVPPTVITTETRAEYQAAMKTYHEKWNSPPASNTPNRSEALSAWIEEVRELMDHVESIGEFQPWIAHDPRAEVVPIHPTVLDDAGRLITMCRAMNKLLGSAA